MCVCLCLCLCVLTVLTVVHGDDVEAIEYLAFVFMDPLHVDVKDGGRVDLQLVLILQGLGKLQLVVLAHITAHNALLCQ